MGQESRLVAQGHDDLMTGNKAVPVRRYLRRTATEEEPGFRSPYSFVTTPPKPAGGRQPRFVAPGDQPGKKESLQASKAKLKDAGEDLRHKRVELRQVIDESKANIAEAKVSVQKSAVDFRDAKENLRALKKKYGVWF